MSRHLRKHLSVLLALGAVLGVLGKASAAVPLDNGGAVTRTLARDLEPVVVSGGAVGALAGSLVDELFILAFSGGGWGQIPAQVDEVTSTGAYTATEDGRLDANDEIVFMAKDLGDQAPAELPITITQLINPDWYEIEVTDPISPTRKGWAYLVHSEVLTPTFDTDYVSFDPGLHRINAASYKAGFAVIHAGMEYLSLGGSGVEILDRTKVRVFCRAPILCPRTEDNFGPVPDNLVKDGPVRVIVRQGQLLAYGSMFRWSSPLELTRLTQGDVRFSTDFNQAVSGATYYNSAVPGGVTVDGITDTVPTAPVSPWWQLSTDHGTMVQLADTSTIGGRGYNYYVDNAERDRSDTGDRQRYGDNGVSIEDPESAFTYTVALYVLPGRQANVGATYEEFFTHPLSVTALWRGIPRPWRAYLPATMRSLSQ